MKKALIIIVVVLGILLVTWGICETAGSDYYSYKGYVTNIFENKNGETVIVTLSGTTESEFAFKWYTRQKSQSGQPIAIGDRVMLSTTHNSDKNIKKIKVDAGYATEGKLVYVEGLSSPFVLSVAPETENRHLISIVTTSIDMLDGLNMGDTVKFYHYSPVYATTITLVSESMAVIERGSINSLTEEDIAFIEAQGYNISLE